MLTYFVQIAMVGYTSNATESRLYFPNECSLVDLWFVYLC
jgi:hypothetical protein